MDHFTYHTNFAKCGNIYLFCDAYVKIFYPFLLGHLSFYY